jgi:hypothetical protein
MKKVRRKVAVTVSPDVLAAAERLRQRTGESRSAVFERALYGLVAAERRSERSRRYVDGYRRRPERRKEVSAALVAAMAALAAEPWDETR